MKNKGILLLPFVSSVLILFSCCTTQNTPSVESSHFGYLSSGEEVTLYKLTNSSGASMEVIDYGCRVVSIDVPDRNGNMDDVVQGYGNIEDFETGIERYFGALIGRYGNRIANATFPLDGKTIKLTANEQFGDKVGHLHGGEKGFDRVMWEAEPLTEEGRVGVCFTRLSPDGEEGYPGNLACKVTYWWGEDNVWRVEYNATTDKPTIVNLSNHTVFNLKGIKDGGYVLDHIMKVDADYYTPNNACYIPLGTFDPVENTPFDLREPRHIDHAIDIPNEHYRTVRGYSVCWVLRDYDGTLREVADLYEPRSGRGVTVVTTEPGLLTYTGRAFNENLIGKEGRAIQKFSGMLLETLHFVDSPNMPELPSTVLRPGEEYNSVTEFHFYKK